MLKAVPGRKRKPCRRKLGCALTYRGSVHIWGPVTPWVHSSLGGLFGLEGVGSKQYQLSLRKLRGCQEKKKTKPQKPMLLIPR